MALVPRTTYRNWWDDIDRYHRDIERHFERLIRYNDDVWRMPPFPSFRSFFRPWRSSLFDDLDRDIGGAVTIDRDGDRYRMVMDVHQFAPEEITVRTDNDYITIEARHKNKPDGRSYVSREFMRRYLLPKGFDMSRVEPSLSSDGILTITAPKFTYLPLTSTDRVLPVKRTWLPAIRNRY